MQLTPELEALEHAVHKAGKIIMNYFGQQIDVIEKASNSDYRTKADVEAEACIIETIQAVFPDYNIFGEEHGVIDKNSDYTFVIDPLDGTNNFVLGIPVFTSSVALFKKENAIMGLIHDPVNQQTYFAQKGKGAYCNGVLIKVKPVEKYKDSVTTYTCNYTTDKKRVYAFKTGLLNFGPKRLLDLWSPAFSYCALASGRLHAVVNDGTELYDFGAGKLIAREAGALISGFRGEVVEDKGDTFVAVSNESLLEELLEKIDVILNRNNLTTD